MTEFGRGPLLDLDRLAALGYRLVLYPADRLPRGPGAAQEALTDLLRHGHQRDRVPQMLTRAELYDLLGYSGYEARDRAYFS